MVSQSSTLVATGDVAVVPSPAGTTMFRPWGVLTSVRYSTSSRSSRLSFSVYLAFPVTASTGPLSTWCLMALNSM
ncbi:hypothetical protein EYF80_053462 [Liparis tanakae]|uniref:Uncharacterized protein n=1 Tax=Liparis tanakae TaxID=230148 RepID=A0A4Z2F5N3_9TELE|nr:hypothetical protein EYF80_053462 [Liparis tanakae]